MSERRRSGEGTDGAAPLEAAIVQRLVEEAGFLFSLRDDEGVLVAGDPAAWGRLPDSIPPTHHGATFLGYRFLAPDGRELPLLKHPAHIARTTGIAQRNVLLGVLGQASSVRWLCYSYLPRERGAGGWSVLSFGADVTDLVAAREAAEQRTQHAEALLTLADGLVAAGDLDSIADAVGAFGLCALPEAQVMMAVRWSARELRSWTARNPTGLEPAPERLPLAGETLARWEHPETHVNLQVGDAEVYGMRVVGGAEVPVRSLVIAPVFDRGRQRSGYLGAASPVPGAFSAEQIRTVERAAALVGLAIDRVRPMSAAA